MKQHLPGFLIGFLLAAVLFLLLYRPRDKEGGARIETLVLDSINYVHRQDSLMDLGRQQREKIRILQEEKKAITFARDEALRRIRNRPTSDFKDADSARTAILRAAGLLHD